jgi:hypothetical protein
VTIGASTSEKPCACLRRKALFMVYNHRYQLREMVSADAVTGILS